MIPNLTREQLGCLQHPAVTPPLGGRFPDHVHLCVCMVGVTALVLKVTPSFFFLSSNTRTARGDEKWHTTTVEGVRDGEFVKERNKYNVGRQISLNFDGIETLQSCWKIETHFLHCAFFSSPRHARC